MRILVHLQLERCNLVWFLLSLTTVLHDNTWVKDVTLLKFLEILGQGFPDGGICITGDTQGCSRWYTNKQIEVMDKFACARAEGYKYRNRKNGISHLNSHV